ncbi:MAG TPA: hypothetical protein VNV16_10820 [Methylibium sp.]|nr:hypothetical protein [Methylibium sp.]
MYTLSKVLQQLRLARRDEKKTDAHRTALQPCQPVPLEPSQLDQVGGAGPNAPRTTW